MKTLPTNDVLLSNRSQLLVATYHLELHSSPSSLGNVWENSVVFFTQLQDANPIITQANAIVNIILHSEAVLEKLKLLRKI